MSTDQVVLWLDPQGVEQITTPEPAEQANERAKGMARDGVNVLSVVDAEYGHRRVNPAKDTRVWFRSNGSDKDEDDMFTGLMSYNQAMVTGEKLREQGHAIVGLISQQQFEERTVDAVKDLFEGGEQPKDTLAELRETLERVEKSTASLTRQDKARATVPDRNAESRRYQAMELALRLLDVKKDTLSPAERKGEGVAKRIVEDARVIERYLKGTTPRTPSTT